MLVKTAISIPDTIFQAAENLAQRLGLSRSELYVKAVNDYIKIHKYQDVTKSLNKVYSSNGSDIENDVYSMQVRSIPKDNWE